MIAAVFFGVGETIVDESHEYGTWADWLGVPRQTEAMDDQIMSAMRGAGR